MSKWVETVPCRAADHRVVLKFLKENILSRFRVPKAIISDGGSHFCNKPFESLLIKYVIRLCQVGVQNQQNLYPRIPTTDEAKLLQYSGSRVEHGDVFSS